MSRPTENFDPTSGNAFMGGNNTVILFQATLQNQGGGGTRIRTRGSMFCNPLLFHAVFLYK
ncbi:MAG: hypothetical protein AMJ53_17825 [Gammaproteobacteria bacterium SG8_11]|nr:MAG: hypothetical protein AMJ53_17825 [Gammaproteobacteria bacterium SG8_11]